MSNQVTILYATMTGNARDCAEKASSSLGKAGIANQIVDLAQYDPRHLADEKTVLVAISTWGEGEPPDDGVNFHDHIRTLEPASLSHLQYAVFALGDTSYEHFCQCGKDIDTIFAACAAQRLLERVDNDVDFTDALDKWCEEIVPVVQQAVAA